LCVAALALRAATHETAKEQTVFSAPQKIFRLIAAGFALIGCGLLAGAFYSYRSTEAFLATAVPATGTVIGYERHTDSEGEISYFPVITFTPEDGDEIEFTASTGGGGRPYKIGAPIALRYDPALPFNAAIDTPSDLWVGPIVLGFLGLIFTVVGSGLFWFFRPGGPSDPPELAAPASVSVVR
jgi:hypothetical protein